MPIRVDYIAQVKNAAGVTGESIHLDSSAELADVLRQLADNHGAEFRSLVFDDDGQVRPSILVTVNDEQVFPRTPCSVQCGDTVAILSPMSGG